MAATLFFPHKFNGFLFQRAGVCSADFDDFDWDIRGLSTNNVQRNNNRPKYAGTILGRGVKVVNVNLVDAHSTRDELVIAMDSASQQQLPLYAHDQFGNEYYCLAKCTALNPESVGDGKQDKEGKFGYIFEVDDPTWISTKTFEDVWNIVADEDEHTVTVGGNQITRPSFEITPGAPVGYWPYTEWIKNYNPVALAQNDGVDITNGGWNTAALILAGKMEADGKDVRVYMDGSEIPFWFGGGGINSATTEIWIVQRWKPGQFMALRTALSGVSTPPRIEWKVTTLIKAALAKMPLRGIIRVGTEEISYENLNAVLCQADIVSRNIRGTSIAAHSVSDVCWWVEHDIKIIYGNTSAEMPVYDDTYKPVINLTTSTNTSRVYADFADTQGLRAGSFIRQVLNDGLGKLNRVYSGNHAAEAEVDPATDMGMEIASYQVQGKVKPESAELAWMYYHPGEIVSVTTTGAKFRSFTTTSWPAKAELQSSKNGTAWVQEWNEVTPASPNTWTALSHTATEALPAGSLYIRFHLMGSVNALVDNFQRMEVATCTLVLNSAKVIQLGMSGEKANYQFTIEIRNNTTQESLFIDYPAQENETIYIDTEAMTVTYKGMNAIRAISWDTNRTDWLHFNPGPNELQYFADPTSTVLLKTITHNRAV